MKQTILRSLLPVSVAFAVQLALLTAVVQTITTKADLSAITIIWLIIVALSAREWLHAEFTRPNVYWVSSSLLFLLSSAFYFLVDCRAIQDLVSTGVITCDERLDVSIFITLGALVFAIVAFGSGVRAGMQRFINSRYLSRAGTGTELTSGHGTAEERQRVRVDIRRKRGKRVRADIRTRSDR